MKYQIAIEGKLYFAIRNIREPILRPIVKFFAFLKFQPELLSYLGVVFMLHFVYFLKINPLTSFYFLIISLFMDLLDGSLARYLKVDSDLGKFTDVIADNLHPK